MRVDVLVVDGEDARHLADALEAEFHARRYTANSGDTEVLVFEEFYLRAGYDLSATIVLDREDSDSCRVEVVSCGGGGSSPLTDGGAEKATINKVRRFVDKFALVNAMKVRTADSRFSSGMVGSTPKSFLKKCMKCGELIPIASEKCEYCGQHQPVR